MVEVYLLDWRSAWQKQERNVPIAHVWLGKGDPGHTVVYPLCIFCAPYGVRLSNGARGFHSSYNVATDE
jgi:hypothetical protein